MQHPVDCIDHFWQHRGNITGKNPNNESWVVWMAVVRSIWLHRKILLPLEIKYDMWKLSRMLLNLEHGKGIRQKSRGLMHLCMFGDVMLYASKQSWEHEHASK